MARVNAGSTLAQQYTPPFVVPDNVSNNWQLRWSQDKKAFEAFDPNELVTATGFSSIESTLFPSVSNRQTYVLDWQAASKESLFITINGVKQHTDTYSIDTSNAGQTIVTLSSPATGDVEFIGLQAEGGATIEHRIFTADGTTTNYTLDWVAPSTASLLVTLDGVKQQTNTYSISITNLNTILSFNDAPSVGVTNVSIVNAGTGYQSNDILTVSGGSFDTAAQIRVDAVSGGSITGVTVIDSGTYSTVPSNPVSVTGGSGNGATFNLTSEGQSIEVVGVTTTGEVPSSPVDANNLGAGPVEGLFANKTTAGEQQILNFKSLSGGSNITLTPTSDFITIAANVPSFNNIGTGTPIAPTPGTTDPLDLRVLTAGDGIGLSVVSNSIVIAQSYGYVSTGSTTYAAISTDRIIGVTNTGSPVTVTLSDIANLPTGDTVTVKDQTGGASSNNITIETNTTETIDSQANYTISTDYGYVTLYNDGTNFHIIAEG